MRDEFFASPGDVANRRREPWVLEAVAYLHHPLRAEASLQLHRAEPRRCCEEIQRTGDIFFPKRWMDATLSGHSSASAARMVRTFLAELPPEVPGQASPNHPVVGRRSVRARRARQSVAFCGCCGVERRTRR